MPHWSKGRTVTSSNAVSGWRKARYRSVLKTQTIFCAAYTVGRYATSCALPWSCKPNINICIVLFQTTNILRVYITHLCYRCRLWNHTWKCSVLFVKKALLRADFASQQRKMFLLNCTSTSTQVIEFIRVVRLLNSIQNRFCGYHFKQSCKNFNKCWEKVLSAESVHY